jgi:enoyl reductase-like protein
MAEESGRGTLERLQQQGERIHSTEKNLDLASNQNKLAAERAREIKTLNRSMFAVHVKNPFTSNSRVADREAQVLEDAQADRQRRDATRSAAWSSNDRAQRLQMDINKADGSGGNKKGSLAERAKYQFEAVSIANLYYCDRALG